MKKSIVYLGIALISFTTISHASTPITISTTERSQPEYSNSTPLNIAIYKQDMKFIKKLVEYGADVNEEKDGFTPLMIAARYNNVEVIKYLVSKGAKISHKNDLGLTAANYAKISNAKEAKEYLSRKLRKTSSKNS